MMEREAPGLKRWFSAASESGNELAVRVSYIENYLEKLRDLLNPTKATDLQVREEAAARLSAWGHECAIAARRRRQRQQQQQQQQHDEGKGAEAEAEGEEKGSGSGTWWLAAAVDLSIL